jgi:uncharacterized protein YbjQ (UPF0145 family)
MPFWKRTSPEEEQRRMQAQQEAEASQRALEAGGLPLQATRRLSEEVAAGHPIFSSDLSTKEFSLTRNLGYQPLSQVMGSSIFHVGWQYTRTYSINPSERELTTVSQAHQRATLLALGRLEQEAALLKAHGVIGVQLTTRDYAWGANMLEFTAIGTAIKLPNTPLPQRPFLSDLSGQEFWTLLQAGYYPVGLVTGFCSYYIALGSSLSRQLKSWFNWTNQEIVPFSQGIYTARNLAMSRLLSMARSLKASGVVGMHINFARQVIEYETESSGPHLDLSLRFSVIGTAITAQRPDHVIPPPIPTLTLTDLRPGRYGQAQGGPRVSRGVSLPPP